MVSLAGSFLVARPVLKDPSFAQTVILLLQHSAEGAFGLVVNRPTRVKGLPFPIFAGGPCPSEGLFLLHGHKEWLDPEKDDPKREVAPGIYLGDASCVNRVREPLPGEELRFRMLTGYSGWGPDQLERELAAGAWAVVPANAAALFETAPEDLWSSLLPPTIPQPSVN
ncbi:MAG TPA: YqgE/AlgH family protein [Gemmataceae bacterium]|nr:YqgE/AlgH family protein [Gemmataceae bacterium]